MHPLSETLRAAAKHIRHFDEAPSVRAAADELDRLHSVELMARESFANTHLIRQRCV